MTTLFKVCAALLGFGALGGWAFGHIWAGVLLAILAIAAILIFLGD